MRNPVRPVVAAALAVALTATACTGDATDDNTPSSGASASQQGSASAAPEVVTKATLGKVTGRLPKKEGAHLKEAIGSAVDAWFDAAFTGGDYPRADFHDAFPGFTTGAKQEAGHDRKLMSNADIGKRIDSVEATRRRVRIDVLAVRRKPVGVTARVVLDFTTTGKVSRHLEVKGRLFLSRNDDGWRVFGYDMTKGGAR